MKIEKSSGVTPTEKLLADLCEKTFLKLWSYPNPYKEDGKEMCDLLAACDNHVFIFFDREARRFDELNDNISTDRDWGVQWRRWKKEAIENQVKTAYGAERYLKSGRKIFLDDNKGIPLPIDIDRSNMIIHKIIIAHGADEACRRYSEENLTGSLAIQYGESSVAPSTPFAIKLEKENPVHVLDSYNLKIILSELDTVADLANYLKSKVEAIQRYGSLFYCGEEDILAHYFLNYDEERRRYRVDIERPGIDGLMIPEGLWLEFQESSKYRRRKDDNKISYLWDRVIQDNCQSALDGTLMGEGTFLKKTRAILEMAKETRLTRRFFVKNMLEAIQNFPEDNRSIALQRRFMLSSTSKTGYVFLQIKCENQGELETSYRPFRQDMLKISCGALKNKFDYVERVVGIAIEAPKFSSNKIEDFAFMECGKWTDEMRKRFELANETAGFSGNGKPLEKRTYDFPDEPIRNRSQKAQRRKPGRNQPCPCGSGKKFKKCCGT